jgi:hypothetical protein
MKPPPCAGALKSLSLMGGPLNTSILKTYRLGGCVLILSIEPPQGGRPSFLPGRNKMLWIRKPTSRYLAATLGKNTEQSHALVTKRPESRLHFQASPFGRLYALVGPKLSTPRFIASAPSSSDEAG